MEIRKATIQDYNQILDIFAYARSFMKKAGNPNQWKDNRPDPSLIENDIKNENLYLVVEDDLILGVFAFIHEKDPTYFNIEGKWLNEDDYSVIHRIASSGIKKGVLNFALNYCTKHANNLRIDTHQDNKIMQHILEKNGFSKCGIIYVDDGTPRLAYQKIIQKGE